MNIVLTGMRGSGKSTIAKMLAGKMNRSFIDMDSLIVKKVGMPLPEFVKKNGWKTFRDKETEVTLETADLTNTIIATGGGVILRKQNVDALKKNGKFVFLKTSIQTMIKRIGEDKNRPALTNKKTMEEELEEVWKERKNLYEQSADSIIETDNKTHEAIVNEIISTIKL
jgi:shikimate kinase